MSRRWLGGIFLFAALGMLVAGETVLRERLGKYSFLVFWLLCFVFTCLAVLIAVVDACIVRRRTREERRALFENTLQDIVRQKKAQPKEEKEHKKDPG